MKTMRNNVTVDLPLQDGRHVIVVDRSIRSNHVKMNERSRNVYLLDSKNNMVWQIRTDFDDEGMAFTNVFIDVDGSLSAYRWDGGTYHIDINNGYATPREFLK